MTRFARLALSLTAALAMAAPALAADDPSVSLK